MCRHRLIPDDQRRTLPVSDGIPIVIEFEIEDSFGPGAAQDQALPGVAEGSRREGTGDRFAAAIAGCEGIDVTDHECEGTGCQNYRWESELDSPADLHAGEIDRCGARRLLTSMNSNWESSVNPASSSSAFGFLG